MKEPIILESNQNHATIIENGICPTLPASMGMGGGYVPMIVQVHYRNDIRIYEDGICPTVSSAYGMGGGTIPLVIMKHETEKLHRSSNGSDHKEI